MTNKYSLATLILILSLAVIASCAKKEGDYLQVIEGNWGHLSEIERTLPSKLYLSHVKKNDSYNVCLARYMTADFPGIEEEIKAAVNIWAHYIGRSINVSITKVDLPRPSEDSPEEDLSEGICPNNSDVVMALSYFNDSAVGKTSTRYSYINRQGKQQITTFRRTLYLKNPVDQQTYNQLDKDTQSDNVVWTSLQKKLGKVLTANDILDLMKKRETVLYMTNPGELLTFKTIVHEFGHVWGMCDMYDLGGGNSNCDPKFATVNAQGHIMLDDEAIMARSSWEAKVYITDDDIEGIRKLASRPHFAADYGTITDFSSITVPLITSSDKHIPVAIVRSAERKGQEVALKMSVVSHGPISIKVRLFDKTYQSWLEFGDTVYEHAISYKSYTLNLNLGRAYDLEKAEVTFAPYNNQDNSDSSDQAADPVDQTVKVEVPVKTLSTSITIGRGSNR